MTESHRRGNSSAAWSDDDRCSSVRLDSSEQLKSSFLSSNQHNFIHMSRCDSLQSLPPSRRKKRKVLMLQDIRVIYLHQVVTAAEGGVHLMISVIYLLLDCKFSRRINTFKN